MCDDQSHEFMHAELLVIINLIPAFSGICKIAYYQRGTR
jgi:hypothetical protein